MYIVIVLLNGIKRQHKRYESESAFRKEYPEVKYIILGHVIYVNQEL